MLTLKRPEGNQAEKVRVLEGIGRFNIIPRSLNIELTEDEGYVCHGTDKRTESNKARHKIMRLLPAGERNAMPQTELFEVLRKHEISESTARRALQWMVEKEQIHRKEEPVRYWKPSSSNHHKT